MSQKEKDDFELIYNQLITQFKGRQVVTLPEAGEVLGYSKSSCPSMYARRTFPIKAIKIGAKPAVRLIDLARYLSSPIPHLPPPPPPEGVERRRGRPPGSSSAAQYARRLAAQQAEQAAKNQKKQEAAEGGAK